VIPPRRLSRLAAHPAIPLIVVAAVYATLQFVAVTTRIRLGWDETVYVSQVNPQVPAAFFGAPRARGVTLLPAPLLAVTHSLTALRAYMTVLSSAGLVVAYWPWTRILRPLTAGMAAFLLVSLWMVQFYGNEIMPNLYVAYGAVAAAGWFVRATREPGLRAPLWLAASLAFVALMRPGDAAWIGLPLVIAIAFARRRIVPAAAIVLGIAVGALEWVIEAYARFGDPVRRLGASSRTEGGLGWHPSGARMELHALNDYLLCRPCGEATWHVSPSSVWWPLVPVLAAGGLALGAREGRARALAIPMVCGAGIGASYLLSVGYAAPRFLIPSYALLALPVACLMTGAASIGRRRWRVTVACAVLTSLALLIAGQQAVLARIVTYQKSARLEYVAIADRLHELGVRPPCTISGEQAPPLAYYAGCRSIQVSGHDRSVSLADLLTAARAGRFATIERTGSRPAYARGWNRFRLTTPGGHHWRLYVPARPTAAPRD
jgi:hypothetical protein